MSNINEQLMHLNYVTALHKGHLKVLDNARNSQCSLIPVLQVRT